jgi:uncharacterized protein (TIGR03067 family)
MMKTNVRKNGCLLGLTLSAILVAGCGEQPSDPSPSQQTESTTADPNASAVGDHEAQANETGDQDAALAELQGVWIIEDAKYHGAEIAGMQGLRAEIMGDKVAIGAPGEGVVSTMRLDTSQDPAWMDTTGTGGTTQAIYKLEGDILWICTGPANVDSGRPAEFATSPDSESMLFQYRRAE